MEFEHAARELSTKEREAWGTHRAWFHEEERHKSASRAREEQQKASAAPFVASPAVAAPDPWESAAARSQARCPTVDHPLLGVLSLLVCLVLVVSVLATTMVQIGPVSGMGASTIISTTMTCPIRIVSFIPVIVLLVLVMASFCQVMALLWVNLVLALAPRH